jgi:hypothetical protein
MPLRCFKVGKDISKIDISVISEIQNNERPSSQVISISIVVLCSSGEDHASAINLHSSIGSSTSKIEGRSQQRSCILKMLSKKLLLTSSAS